jgi:hypothetical protein
MKFRKWFHKMGGDKNFTEDQISTAIANKFKTKTMKTLNTISSTSSLYTVNH